MKSQSQDSDTPGPSPGPGPSPHHPPAKVTAPSSQDTCFSPSSHFFTPTPAFRSCSSFSEPETRGPWGHGLHCLIHTESHAQWVLPLNTHPPNCETAVASGTRRLLRPKGELQAVWMPAQPRSVSLGLQVFGEQRTGGSKEVSPGASVLSRLSRGTRENKS